MTKVCVIGVDLTNCEVIKPPVESGKLPNIGKLISDGVLGNIGSTILPMGVPAWVSFLHGKNPGMRAHARWAKKGM